MVRFLDLEKEEVVHVSGTDESGNDLARVRVPFGGQMLATAVDLDDQNYFNVATLRIEMGDGIKRATGAVAALEYRECIGKHHTDH